MEPALTLTDLHRHYGDVAAVDGVTLRVKAGERFVLLGPSGSGKTSILRLVAGFDVPTGGSVALDGLPVAGLPPERRNVGVVFQDYALFPHRTVAQNIEFGLRMRKVDRSARRQQVGELLDLVGLTCEAGRKPDQLSGGQRQRVALARALAPRPALLLLDEPLANLDRRLRESLRNELLRITDAVGITSVLVTHDQEEALSFADRVAVLRAGKVVQTGTPVDVWRAPADTFVATFLGDMNLLPVQAINGDQVKVTGIDGLLQAEGSSVATAPARERPDREGPAPGFNDRATSNRQSSRAVVACLRPEALTAVMDPAGPGTVQHVFYAGGSATMTIDVDGTSITVRAQQPDGRPPAAAGDTVRIQPAVSQVRLLDDPGIRA